MPATDLRATAGCVSEESSATDSSAAIERARLATTKGIKAALSRIEAAHPALGQHLLATVRRGSFCSYLPDPRHPIKWKE